MPIVWRFILGQYFKVLVLCVVSFIAILLTTRLEEIAHFASLGAQGQYVLWFTLHQIPYILPIALPISSLISAVILIQSLSTSHELTALRSCGMALRQILAPILLSAAYLTILNFYVVSEMATHSHLTASTLKSELRSVNPLLVLHNKHLMRLKGFYFDTLGASRMGESASKIVLATPNKHNNRIHLMLAENLQATPESFIGTGVSLITSLRSDNQDKFDHIMIENIGQAHTSIQDFSQLLQKKVWSVNNDHLALPLLMVKLQEETDKSNISRAYTEIIRRLSIALAVFTFTLMGLAFGMSISRNKSNKGLFCLLALAAIYLGCFFTAKGIEKNFVAASCLYLLPHVLIVVASVWTIRRTSQGVEA